MGVKGNKKINNAKNVLHWFLFPVWLPLLVAGSLILFTTVLLFIIGGLLVHAAGLALPDSLGKLKFE